MLRLTDKFYNSMQKLNSFFTFLYYLHFVTIPSTHTKLPRKREVSVLGVTCLFPKLPSKATKNSLLLLA